MKKNIVEFIYSASTGTNSVSLAGSFNNWDKNAAPMEFSPDSLWRTRLELPDGEHQYKFVIDGENWETDPDAKEYTQDMYRNAVITIGKKTEKPKAKAKKKPKRIGRLVWPLPNVGEGLVPSRDKRETTRVSPTKTGEGTVESFAIYEGDNINYIFRDYKTKASCHIMIPAIDPEPQIIAAFPAGESAVSFRTSDSLWTLTEAEPFLADNGQHGMKFSVKSDRKKIKIILPWTSFDNIVNLRIAIYYSPTHEDFPKGIVKNDDGTITLFGTKDKNFREKVLALPPDSIKHFEETTEIGVDKFLKRNLVNIKITGNRISAFKETIDGKNRYQLEIVIPDGYKLSPVSENGELEISGKKEVEFSVSASVDFTTPTPVPMKDVLTKEALKKADEDPAYYKLMRNFTSLVYEEKLLAGSWYYVVYFGRDTLNATRLMWDALSTKTKQRIVLSVLNRLADDGTVAVVEELNDYPAAGAINEFYGEITKKDFTKASAILSDIALGKRASWKNYNVLDATFMLPVVVKYFLEETKDEDLKAFLSATNERNEQNAVSILRNINRILSLTDNFSMEPAAKNLVQLDKSAGSIGNWRDSGHGLGWGIYPGDINMPLVMAALESSETVIEKIKTIIGETMLFEIADKYSLILVKSLFPNPLNVGEALVASRNIREGINPSPTKDKTLQTAIMKWKASGDFFRVTLTAEEVRKKLTDYLNFDGLPTDEKKMLMNVRLEPGISVKDFIEKGKTPESLKNGLSFPAISLDKDGKPVPIMHSDEVYSLLDRDLAEDEAKAILKYIFMPYPVGLFTDAGMLITNPVYQTDKTLWGGKKWEGLSRRAYHGAVVWGWPMRALILGLCRQIRFAIKSGFSKEYIESLKNYLDMALKTEENAGELSNSELWTWEPVKGRAKAAAFGQSTQPSTPVQLWSGSSKNVTVPATLKLYEKYISK